MAYETKPNRGSIFENDKQGVDSRPDMKGKARIGDSAYWVSGWWSSSRNGDYLSLSFEEMTDEQIDKFMPEARRANPGQPPRSAGRVEPDPGYRDRAKAATQRARERMQSMGKPARGFDDVPFDDDIPF